MNDVKTPLFRLAKRDELGRGKVWAIRAGSIIVALILGCIPMLLTGNSPAEAYGVILQGSLSRPIYKADGQDSYSSPWMCSCYSSMLQDEVLEHRSGRADHDGSCCGNFFCSQFREDDSSCATSCDNVHLGSYIRRFVGSDSCIL